MIGATMLLIGATTTKINASDKLVVPGLTMPGKEKLVVPVYKLPGTHKLVVPILKLPG